MAEEDIKSRSQLKNAYPTADDHTEMSDSKWRALNRETRLSKNLPLDGLILVASTGEVMNLSSYGESPSSRVFEVGALLGGLAAGHKKFTLYFPPDQINNPDFAAQGQEYDFSNPATAKETLMKMCKDIRPALADPQGGAENNAIAENLEKGIMLGAKVIENVERQLSKPTHIFKQSL